MTEKFRIPAGSRLRVGAPAEPLPIDVSGELARGLAAISPIIEAHLPLCQLLPGMHEPRMTLVVVFEEGTNQDASMPLVIDLVKSIVPPSTDIDVWPLGSENTILNTIRHANCLLPLS